MTELVPEGYYKAVGVKTVGDVGDMAVARMAWTKKNKRQVHAVFEILEEGEQKGRRLWWYGFFTEGAGKRTAESLRFMGMKGNELDTIEEQPLDQIVSIKVGHDEYEGRTTARVDFVNRPGGAVVKLNKRMSRDDLRKFSAMMRDSMASISEVDGERYVKESAPDGVQGDGDPRVDDSRGGEFGGEFGADSDDPGYNPDDGIPF